MRNLVLCKSIVIFPSSLLFDLAYSFAYADILKFGVVKQLLCIKLFLVYDYRRYSINKYIIEDTCVFLYCFHSFI